MIDGKQVKLRSEPLNRLAKDILYAPGTATYTVPGTSLSNITGVSVALRSGSTYMVTTDIQYSITGGVTPSIGIAFNFSGTTSRWIAQQVAFTNTTAAESDVSTTQNAELAFSPALPGTRGIRSVLQLACTSAGTLTLQGRRSSGTLTLEVLDFIALEL